MILPAQNNLLLELHVPDFDLVKEYYLQIGFHLEWERPAIGRRGYLILTLENNILCFWAGNENVYEHDYFAKFPKDTPRGYGVELVLMVNDVKAYYEKVKNKANVIESLQRRSWGLEDFRTLDPFGYYLRFTTYHNILDQSSFK